VTMGIAPRSVELLDYSPLTRVPVAA